MLNPRLGGRECVVETGEQYFISSGNMAEEASIEKYIYMDKYLYTYVYDYYNWSPGPNGQDKINTYTEKTWSADKVLTREQYNIVREGPSEEFLFFPFVFWCDLVVKALQYKCDTRLDS